MNSKKSHIIKRLFVSLSLLLNVAIVIIVVSSWHIVRPALGAIVKSYPPLYAFADAVRDTLRPENNVVVGANGEISNDEVMQGIEALIDMLSQQIQPLPSESERLDFLQNFVHNNSIHKGDEDYAWDTQKVLWLMSRFYETQTNPPHLTCGSRALTLKAILDKLEIDNRMIMILGSHASRVVSHTFLEAYNKDTQEWELHDPDKNLYYRHIKTFARASTLQLVLQQVEMFEPCSLENGCGWEENKMTAFVENRRFGAVAYDNRPYLQRQIFSRNVYERTMVVVNTDRMSVTKKFPGNEEQNFIQWANKIYRKPTFVFHHQFE